MQSSCTRTNAFSGFAGKHPAADNSVALAVDKISKWSHDPQLHSQLPYKLSRTCTYNPHRKFAHGRHCTLPLPYLCRLL
jgi:hypothetical protein